MKTPEQLKGAIRNIAKEKDLHAQEVLQIFMFERILERLSLSPYKKNFVLKGGLLISSMIGISERTTMDMDTTVRGIDMDEENIERIVKEIFDIDTGDEITPAAVEYSFHTMFDEKDIDVYAYTLETILAEKYETVIRRGIGNTRSRDFYDLYVLFHLYRDSINPAHFRLAVEHTAKKRGSFDLLKKYESICADVKAEESLVNDWSNYIADETYAARLSFDEVVDNAVVVGKYLENIPENN